MPLIQAVPLPAAVEYPSSDGKPMADNDTQRAAIMYVIGVLEVRYAHRPDVYVSGDLLLYYEEGDPRASVAPDAFVVFGAEDRPRQTYRLWEEPKAPDFVLEVASRSSWREDDGPKAALYRWLGVREYWQYDPTGEHLGTRLKGRRLVDGVYQTQPVLESPDGARRLESEVLGLEMRVRGEEMYFFDPVAGQRLLGHREEHAARLRERAARLEERAARLQERAARRAAEARIAALEALLRGNGRSPKPGQGPDS